MLYISSSIVCKSLHLLNFPIQKPQGVKSGEKRAKANQLQVYYRPIWFQEVEAPRFPDNQNKKVVRLSALCTGCLYPPEYIPGTHFCQRLSRPRHHSAAGMIVNEKQGPKTVPNYAAM